MIRIFFSPQRLSPSSPLFTECTSFALLGIRPLWVLRASWLHLSTVGTFVQNLRKKKIKDKQQQSVGYQNNQSYMTK